MMLQMGASRDELASRPMLIIDLAMSLLPRRVGVAAALCTLVGGNAAEKVRGLTDEVEKQTARLKGYSAAQKSRDVRPISDVLDAAADLMAAVARLENAVFTLAKARVRRGLRIVPPAPDEMASA